MTDPDVAKSLEALRSGDVARAIELLVVVTGRSPSLAAAHGALGVAYVRACQ